MSSPTKTVNDDDVEDTRALCRYGKDCYQKNPDHHKKFRHPDKNNSNAKRKSPGDDYEQSLVSKKPRSEDSTCDVVDEEVSEDVKKTSEVKDQNKQDDSKNLLEKNNVIDETDKNHEDKNGEETKVVSENVNHETMNNQTKNEKTNSEKCSITKKSDVKDSVTMDKNGKKSSTNKSDCEQLSITKNKVAENKNKNSPKAESVKNSLEQTHQLIQDVFLFPMPSDFYKFYDMCQRLKPSDPTNALRLVGLILVGPFDILAGKITKDTPNLDSFLTHWRYYYDPPEFQTVLKGNDKEGLHFGYWRDRPSGDPAFVAANSSNVNHKIIPVAENIFGAVINYLEEKIKKATPFERTSFTNLLGRLKASAKEYGFPIESKTPKMKSREKNVVARTIHGAGIVCPFNKKTQLGYRELSVTDDALLKIVKKIEEAKDDDEKNSARGELQEVVRLATIAGDECDFGTCLELGHDLFSTGCADVQNAALSVLSIAYNQLERQPFLKIVEAHMKNRKKDCNVSALPKQN
ncbi:hypothetical protein TKK_0004205 [Trichogramma kaykai]